MSRLTERFGQNATTKEPCYIPSGIGKQEGNPLNEIINKLGRLEDLADEGRLIELPCLPNEPVWVGHVKYSFDELFTELKYTSIQAILKAMEDGFVIGRTKEDVKRKLAELKGGAE